MWRGVVPPIFHFIFEGIERWVDSLSEPYVEVERIQAHSIRSLFKRTEIGFPNEEDSKMVDSDLPFELENPAVPIEYLEFEKDEPPFIDEYEESVAREDVLFTPHFDESADLTQPILSFGILTVPDEDTQLELDNLAIWKSLSFRHKEVVALICMRQTNPQIAETLNIAFGTAKNHVEKILEKCQMPDRYALIFLFRDWDFETWWELRKFLPTPLPSVRPHK